MDRKNCPRRDMRVLSEKRGILAAAPRQCDIREKFPAQSGKSGNCAPPGLLPKPFGKQGETMKIRTPAAGGLRAAARARLAQQMAAGEAPSMWWSMAPCPIPTSACPPTRCRARCKACPPTSSPPSMAPPCWTALGTQAAGVSLSDTQGNGHVPGSALSRLRSLAAAGHAAGHRRLSERRAAERSLRRHRQLGRHSRKPPSPAWMCGAAIRCSA